MPNFYNPYQQIYPQNYFQNANNSANNNTIQNGGFVSVRSENEVFNYPVAPGNCVTFKIEGKPIVMEKSMGFSQLEEPHVERYRLVKEDVVENAPEPPQDAFNIQPIKNTIDDIESEIKAIWEEIEGIKNAQSKRPIATKRKEDGGD